jgi:acyl-CoA hydrolase
MPLNLGEVPDYYRRFLDPVDIVILKTCPMDQNGCFNFSASNMWHRAVIERARMVIVEVSKSLPYACGDENGVHLSEVDYIVEGDGDPAPELPNPQPCEVDRAVARRIAVEIEDGACLQIGIGGMPNAVCTLLLESGVRDLGIHTEMLTDGIADLYKSGRITGSRKTLDPGKIAYTFALGSSALYAVIDRNPDCFCRPVDYTNSPHIIMRNDRVVSINNTTQIDLQGQAASESDGHRHISGTGGQLQFVRGAYASKGGKSFICMASTYQKLGEPRSRIVLNLTPGNIVTTPRSDVMYVVTEYGLVNLKGKSVAPRRFLLASISHRRRKIVAPVSRPAVLGASWPPETSPDAEFWVFESSVRNAGRAPDAPILTAFLSLRARGPLITALEAVPRSSRHSRDERAGAPSLRVLCARVG